jgi:chemotaxis protein MotA
VSTGLGILLGSIFIVASIALGGGWRMFLNLESFMIVVGGTIAATLISFPFSRVMRFFKLFISLFAEKRAAEVENVVGRLVLLGHKAAQDSIFSLEKEARSEKNRYIRIGLQMLLRDSNPAKIARRYSAEIEGAKGRNKEGVQLFAFMAMIAPSFGLVGTLIGLINMLRGIGADVDPGTLGPAMAVALLTTLYGAILAFFLFKPASEKLKAYAEHEMQLIRLTRDAVLMMKEGESARSLEEMLNAHLPFERRRSFLNKHILGKG